MTRVSISELKAKLSRYLDLVRQGEEVIVTDRGKPVARIAPLRGTAADEARLAMLVRTGRVRPPIGRRIDPAGLERPADPAGRSLQALLEERARAR